MSERDGRPRGPRPGPLRRAAAAAGVAAAMLLAGGCASLMGPFGTAPDGLSQYDHDLRVLLREGRHDSALARVAPDRAEVGDELLRLQHEVLLAHHAGRYRESNEALEEAVRIAEDRYTKSVSRALLSVVTSDRVIPYDPPEAERLLLHYYGALNYLRLKQPGEAAVEARRLSRELVQGEEDDLAPGRRDLHVFLHRFAGAVFEAAGERDAARVSLRRAARLEGKEETPAGPTVDPGPPPRPPLPGDSVTPPKDSVPRAAVATADTAAAIPAGGVPDAAGGSVEPPLEAAASGRATGEVVLVVERGFVAHRVERSLNILLWPEEMRRLRPARLAAAGGEGDATARDSAERLETALEVARRALSGGDGKRGSARDRSRPRFPWPWRGPRAGPVVSAGGDAGPAHAREEDEAAGGAPDPYLLRVAWPAYRREDLTGRVTVEGGHGARASPSGRASVSDAAVEEFRGDEARLLATTILRGVAKAAVAGKIEEELSEEDETLGDIAGLTANALGALLERADTRCWHLLPDRLSMVRLRLPAGTHTLQVGTAGPVSGSSGAAGAEVPVRVRAGGLTVASVRLWR